MLQLLCRVSLAFLAPVKKMRHKNFTCNQKCPKMQLS